jgi:N-methylhydantoinase B
MTTLDPIDYAVISQALIAAAREMGVKLIRSAYSTILREARDGSAGLLDAKGQVVAQAELIPMQLGSLGHTFGPCADAVPVEDLVEGDFYITNHPFQGGQHLQDIFIFSPIFVEGEVVGFAASVAHHLDIGGGSPGLNAGATDLYQEGLIIPPSRYNLQRDWNGGNLERLLTANFRVPDQTIGDLNAQFAANSIGIARVQQFSTKYGAALVKATMQELMDYSERRVRTAIAEIPNGVYYGEDAVDDDGISSEPLHVKVQVTITDESVDVDFAGTHPQVGRNLNVPFASCQSAALACLKSVLTSADIPFNEGSRRPFTVVAPYGSLLNPRPPAPVRARMEGAYRAFDAVMKALAKAVPDKVMAIGFDSTTVVCLSYLGEGGRYRVYLDILGGGWGASARADGCDAVDGPLSNCSNTPVEALDMEYDFFRVVEAVITPESFGHGAFRGGAGFSRRYEILKAGATFAIYSDRFQLAPEGLFGGTPGAVGQCTIWREGQPIAVKSKDYHTLQIGDVVEIRVGGGAGYGKPCQRARHLIEEDIADGHITRDLAREVYSLRDTAKSPCRTSAD